MHKMLSDLNRSAHGCPSIWRSRSLAILTGRRDFETELNR
jgi:hypothetical protein